MPKVNRDFELRQFINPYETFENWKQSINWRDWYLLENENQLESFKFSHIRASYNYTSKPLTLMLSFPTTSIADKTLATCRTHIHVRSSIQFHNSTTSNWKRLLLYQKDRKGCTLYTYWDEVEMCIFDRCTFTAWFLFKNVSFLQRVFVQPRLICLSWLEVG